MKTDYEIRADVQDELNWEPRLKSNEIGLAVKNGIVSMFGTVKSYDHKSKAEKTALRVTGVRGVVNELEVRLPADNKRSDAEIAEAAANSLKWNVEVPDEKIKVSVEDGWITLKGEVEWRYQYDEAAKCVSRLIGVKGVTNAINVKPRLTSTSLKNQIVHAFERNADIQAKDLEVEVHGNDVTLKGEVPTWHQYRLAELTAWNAPGIEMVRNQIHVEESIGVY